VQERFGRRLGGIVPRGYDDIAMLLNVNQPSKLASPGGRRISIGVTVLLRHTHE
jgi:hypothetical protein